MIISRSGNTEQVPEGQEVIQHPLAGRIPLPGPIPTEGGAPLTPAVGGAAEIEVRRKDPGLTLGMEVRQKGGPRLEVKELGAGPEEDLSFKVICRRPNGKLYHYFLKPKGDLQKTLQKKFALLQERCEGLSEMSLVELVGNTNDDLYVLMKNDPEVAAAIKEIRAIYSQETKETLPPPWETQEELEHPELRKGGIPPSCRSIDRIKRKEFEEMLGSDIIQAKLAHYSEEQQLEYLKKAWLAYQFTDHLKQRVDILIKRTKPTSKNEEKLKKLRELQEDLKHVDRFALTFALIGISDPFDDRLVTTIETSLLRERGSIRRSLAKENNPEELSWINRLQLLSLVGRGESSLEYRQAKARLGRPTGLPIEGALVGLFRTDVKDKTIQEFIKLIGLQDDLTPAQVQAQLEGYTAEFDHKFLTPGGLPKVHLLDAPFDGEIEPEEVEMDALEDLEI